MMLLLPVMGITAVPGEGGEGGAGGGDAGAGGDGGSILGGAGGDPGAGGEGGGGGGDAGGGGGGEDDLSKLFTPELIEARKQELAATKAEEARRAGLTDEQREEEDRLKAEEAAKQGVPEKYELKFPEGVEITAELLEEFTPLAKELGLNNEQAQKLADFEAKLVQRRYESYNQMTQEWVATAKKDKEYGGDKWEASVETAQRALNTFGTPELKTALNQYKLGNHPELIRLMVRIGNNMKEDGMVLPGGQGAEKGDIATRLYGDSK